MNDYLVVFITCPKGEAEKISSLLIEKRVAACVNIADVSSIFRWMGKIEKADEELLIAKTRASLFDELVSMVKSIHSYEVPEIIALPIVKGTQDYLQWLDGETVR